MTLQSDCRFVRFKHEQAVLLQHLMRHMDVSPPSSSLQSDLLATLHQTVPLAAGTSSVPLPAAASGPRKLGGGSARQSAAAAGRASAATTTTQHWLRLRPARRRRRRRKQAAPCPPQQADPGRPAASPPAKPSSPPPPWAKGEPRRRPRRPSCASALHDVSATVASRPVPAVASSPERRLACGEPLPAAASGPRCS
jgi:hypothetical protein